MYLFRGGDMAASLSPEAAQAHMQRWVEWMKKLAESEAFASGEPLATDGKVVRSKGSIVTDGPFVEGKEVVGGYLIINASDYDQAVQISKDCPIFEYADGSIEVREIQNIPA